jgi:hypothetical protein
MIIDSAREPPDFAGFRAESAIMGGESGDDRQEWCESDISDALTPFLLIMPTAPVPQARRRAPAR